MPQFTPTHHNNKGKKEKENSTLCTHHQTQESKVYFNEIQ
jgi:hypothetical protein